MKQCTQCKREGLGPKPLSDFCKGSDRDGLQSMCREHTRAYNRAWVKANPEKNRAKGKRFRENNPKEYRVLWVRANLKKNYGISEQQYAEMFEAQRGRCAVCDLEMVSQLDTSRDFDGHPANEVARVDHCHETGKVRGLLCFGCNVGLGKFGDDEELLLKAVRYLRASRATAPDLDRMQHETLQSEIEPRKRDLDSSTSRGNRRDQLSPFH